MESSLTTETDKHFDDAFIEDTFIDDSDQNNIVQENSSETVNDRSMRSVHNSSFLDKQIAPDCQDILYWPLENLNRSDKFCIWEFAGVTPKSTEKNCIWETTGITPKSTDRNGKAGITPKSTERKCIWEVVGVTPNSTDKTVYKSTKQNFVMDYSTASTTPTGLTNSPVTFSAASQNNLVNTDMRIRHERKVKSGKKVLQTRARSIKKRTCKQTDVPRKRKCLSPSTTTVPPVSLEDSPSRLLLDSKEDLKIKKSVILTSVTVPNSSSANGVPLNSVLETKNAIVNTVTVVRKKSKPAPEKKLLAASTKVVKTWTKTVPRKRKHVSQLVGETLASNRFLSENETSVSFPLCSDKAVRSSPGKNEMIQTTDDITSWIALPASNENLDQNLFGQAFSNNSDADKQNSSSEINCVEKLFSSSMLANKVTKPYRDENAVLSDELRDWEPFSTATPSRTVDVMTEDAEDMPLQDTVTSDPYLATQSINVQLKDAKRKNRRKSVSADREIASQLVLMPSYEISDSSLAFPDKRYPQRLRRRSTAFQFTQIEPFSDAEAPADAPHECSQPEPGSTKAGNETDMHLESESPANVDDMKLGFENTAISGDELNTDFDASILDSDFHLYPVPAKRSRTLRRKSTELFRLSKNNQPQALYTLEEKTEQQESTLSQKAQKDASAESRGKQNGTNKTSRTPKKKKEKAEEGPPLEDIYLNRLWRSQMPKEAFWETIPEDPKYSRETGGLRLFSARKTKRLLDFDEGPSLAHLKKRKLKAMKNGWKPITKKKEIALSNLLEKKLSQLDEEIGVVDQYV